MEEHNLKAELITTSSKMTSTNKKRKSCYDNMKEHPLLGCKKWEDMDFNILKKIFSWVIPHCDLFWNVSSVCRSWRSACWDYLFWSKKGCLNLNVATSGLGEVNALTLESLDVLYLRTIDGFFGKLSSEGLSVKFMKLLRTILEGNDAYGSSLESWTESIISVYIPMDLDVSDEHLVYIAKRTPALKHAGLLGASKLTWFGFSLAFYHWQDVRVITLGPFNVEDVLFIISEIGMHCTELCTLAIHNAEFSLDFTTAVTLSNCMPQLTKLEFEGVSLCKTAMLHLFTKVPLESVIFYECLLMEAERDLRWKPLDFIFRFKDRSSWTIGAEAIICPDDPILLCRRIINWLSIRSVQIDIRPQSKSVVPTFHWNNSSYYPIEKRKKKTRRTKSSKMPI